MLTFDVYAETASYDFKHAFDDDACISVTGRTVLTKSKYLSLIGHIMFDACLGGKEIMIFLARINSKFVMAPS